MSFSPTGIIPALWTPTDAEGRVLTEALRRNLEFILAARVHSILVLGSTGEFIHFSTDERKGILDSVLNHAGSTPVLVNISAVNPRHVRELGRHAKASGAVAVSLLPPWFFPMSDDDLVEFFVSAAELIDLPLILYNFHALTGKKLTPEVVRRIASRVQIGGLKQSAGELEEHAPLIQVGREFNFNVVTGWDTHIPETHAMGAKGCVAGLANVVPDLLMEVWNRISSGDQEGARKPADKMRRIGKALGALEFPHNIAAAMQARGLEVGIAKSVRSEATQKRAAALRAELEKILATDQ